MDPFTRPTTGIRYVTPSQEGEQFPNARDTRHCSYTMPDGFECGTFTRGRKPYCTDHAHEMPYVQGLIKRLAQADNERDGSPIAPDSPFLQEVLPLLEEGKTGAGICKILSLDPALLLRILKTLDRPAPIWTRKCPQWPSPTISAD